MSKFKLYPWVEIFFVSLFTLLFYSLLQKYIIPRTYHSDVIWYLEAAFHNLGDFLLWVNRYAHVYFLKIFFLFSNDPFEVGKNYWVFMFTATTLLVYLNARLLTPRSKFLHGILAVGFFLSINVFSNTLGVPLVDYTSMLIVLTISLVYLSSLRRGHTVKWLLILLGFLFFIAFKTKETAWVSAILLFGLMFDENNTFNVESLKKNGLQVLIGGLIGGLLFIVLDGLLLKDPLFGLRPANLSTPTGFFINANPNLTEPGNWYNNVLFQAAPHLLAFYLISLVKQKKHAWPLANRLFWSIPIFTILSITAFQLTANYDLFLLRFLFPVLAIFSIAAPQFIEFKMPVSKKDQIIFWSTLILGSMFLRYVWLGTEIFSNINDLDHPQLINSLFRPIIFTLLLLLILLVDKYKSYFVFIPIFLIIGFLIQPIKKNYQALAIPEEIYTVQPRFYPFMEFEDQIEFSPEMSFYISPNVPKTNFYLSENVDTVVAVFNLVFNVQADRENFIFNPTPEELMDIASNNEFDYVLLVSDDWNQYFDGSILDFCAFNEDSDEILVLLDCR